MASQCARSECGDGPEVKGPAGQVAVAEEGQGGGGWWEVLLVGWLVV